MNKFKTVFKINFDKNRIYGLDILRAVAIFVVVLGHGSNLLSVNVENLTAMFIPDGVGIFFVLSGFLIGGILIKILENEQPTLNTLHKFWTRRWIRTLPLYYFVLILLIVLNCLFDKGFSIWETKHFFYFGQNFYQAGLSFFLVSWSLAVEEWFYLLIPIIIFTNIAVLKLKPRQGVLSTAITVILLTIAYRYYRYTTINVDSVEIFGKMFRNAVITRLDSLMFGVTGAWLFYYKQLYWIKNKTRFFIAGIILHVTIKIFTDFIFINSAFYFCNFSFILEAVATLLLLPFLSQLKAAEGITYKIITIISLISYSMYLLHAEIVKNWIIWFINLPGINNIPALTIKYILYWVLTIILSILSYKYIEMPFMKLRNKK